MAAVTNPTTTKRQAQLDLLKPLNELLAKLNKHKFSWVFSEAVDPVKLNIPDYFTIITKPMDLGTVAKKLKENQYSTHQEFANDVNQIWENAMTYNPPKNDVHEMGKSMKEFFAKVYEGFVQKIEQAPALSVVAKASAHKAAAEEAPEAPPKVKKVSTPVKSPVPAATPPEKKMKREREDGEEGAAPPKKRKKAAATGEDGAVEEKKVHKKKPPMKLEEKQQLGINIVKMQHFVMQNKIPRDKLHKIVQIAREATGEADVPLKPEDEIELDIGTMDNKTLWRLDGFVKGCLAAAAQ